MLKFLVLGLFVAVVYIEISHGCRVIAKILFLESTIM